MSAGGHRPELAGLWIADQPVRWEALGFAAVDSAIDLGGVRVSLGAEGSGITAWTLRGIDPGTTTVDGLLTTIVDSPVEPRSPEHPNGAIAIDHVVVVTPDFQRTADAVGRLGMPLRRVREVPGDGERPAFRQGFRRLGPAIFELVEVKTGLEGPARFWGLVVVVSDVEVLKGRLGGRLGTIRQAVQPGRRIATLRDAAGVTPKLAFMDPEVGRADV
jgi:hypothetical protein